MAGQEGGLVARLRNRGSGPRSPRAVGVAPAAEISLLNGVLLGGILGGRMSRENVEILREVASLYEAGDWVGFGALFTERAGVWPPDGWPEPGPYFGNDAVVDEFRRIHEPWETN